MEIDHNQLIENSVQMHTELEQLRTKVLEMQTNNLKNNIEIIDNYIGVESELNILQLEKIIDLFY